MGHQPPPSIECWGGDAFGALGDGGDTAVPYAINTSPTIYNATSLAVGSYHACAVIPSAVWCWGYNGDGELGLGNMTNSPPTAVPGLTTATQVAAGSEHTCALLASGAIQCWGSNKYGQVGVAGSANVLSPVTVSW